MFQGKGLWDVFQAGGYAMWVLLACSIVSLSISVERVMAYRRARIEPGPFMARIRRALTDSDAKAALLLCEEQSGVLSSVVESGVSHYGRPEREVRDAVERQLVTESLGLDRWTGVVGTIGGLAVYIGLFGTVVGIIRAFGMLVQVSPEGTTVITSGITSVIPGIAEALVATATGLVVAVPSVAFYNYFMRQKELILTEADVAGSEIVTILSSAPGGKDATGSKRG